MNSHKLFVLSSFFFSFQRGGLFCFERALYSPGWPPASCVVDAGLEHRSACLHFLNATITGVPHHTRPFPTIFRCLAEKSPPLHELWVVDPRRRRTLTNNILVIVLFSKPLPPLFLFPLNSEICHLGIQGPPLIVFLKMTELHFLSRATVTLYSADQRRNGSAGKGTCSASLII